MSKKSFIKKSIIVSSIVTLFVNISMPLKTQALEGDILWTDVFGGSGIDYFSEITKTSDGGYVAVGTFDSTNIPGLTSKGLSDGFLIKYDSVGNREWVKRYGGTREDYLRSIKQTSDGGYITTGYTVSNDNDFTGAKGSFDGFVMKLNANGDKEWVKRYGGTYNDYFSSLILTDNGDVVIGGYSASFNGDFTGLNKGNFDVFLAKFDSNGNKKWIKNYGGSVLDVFLDFTKTSDGSYAIVGYTNSNNGDFSSNKGITDALIGKFNSDGNKIWLSSYGGSNDDILYGIAENKNKELIAVGYSKSNNGDIGINYGDADMMISKFDSLGNKKEINILGSSGVDLLFGVLPTQDGSILYSGRTDSTTGEFSNNKGLSDALLIKEDKNGNRKWLKMYGGSNVDSFAKIFELNNDQVFAIASTISSDGFANVSYGSIDGVIVELEKPDSIPPSEIINLNEVHDGNSIKLSWLKPSDVDYKEVRIYKDNQLLTSTTEEEFTEDNLQSETIYDYKITTVDTAGNESSGVSISVKTSDITPPNSPQNIKGTGENKEINLNWDSNGELDLKGYNVYLNSTKVNESIIASNSYKILGLEDRETYEIAVTAVDQSDNESVLSEKINVEVVDNISPNAPQNLTGDGLNEKININWNINNEQDLLGYNIYVNGTKHNNETIQNPVYEISNLENRKNYEVYITAIDKSNNESSSSEKIQIEVKDTISPIAPQNLTGIGMNEKININWSDNEEEDLKGYNIYIDGVKHNQELIVNNDYELFNLENGKVYEIYVTAIDKSNNESIFSKKIQIEVKDTIFPSPPLNLKGSGYNQKIDVAWDRNTEVDLIGYNIYLNSIKQNDKIIVDNFFNFKSLVNNGIYEIFITAVDKANNESNPSEKVNIKIIDTTPPAPPKDTKYKMEEEEVIVSWKESEEEDVIGYHIYINDKLYTNELIKDTQISLKLGKGNYEIRVVAVDSSFNESAKSTNIELVIEDKKEIEDDSKNEKEQETENNKETKADNKVQQKKNRSSSNSNPKRIEKNTSSSTTENYIPSTEKEIKKPEDKDLKNKKENNISIKETEKMDTENKNGFKGVISSFLFLLCSTFLITRYYRNKKDKK